MSIQHTTRPFAESPEKLPQSTQAQVVALDNQGYDVHLSRNPRKPEVDITISTDIDVLTHYVKIEPLYKASTQTILGYHITHFHDQQVCDPTTVAKRAPNRKAAIAEATDFLDQLQ